MTFIESIKSGSGKISLKKYDPPCSELLISDQDCVVITFLDTETTGIDRHNDKIIEIAMKTVSFDKTSFKIVSIDNKYESFNDPEVKISEEITYLTGIDNKMVEGQFINWDKVDQIFKTSDLVIAHNASFDRAFVDKFSIQSPKKIWGCSVNDVDWLSKGFASSKQELLCYWHGFYFDSHRAMNDVDALIHLLTHNSYTESRPIIEIFKKASESDYIIFADNFQFDSIKKDILKSNKYRWNNQEKIWFKNVKYDELEAQKEWLTSIIYDSIFEGRVQQINPVDKYKL